MKWWQIALIILYVADLVYLNFSYFSSRPNLITTKVVKETVIPTPIDQCGLECRKYIDTKLASLPTSTPYIIPTLHKLKTKQVTYLPISVSGSTLSNDWVNISGADFYFDIADYPGIKEIYFEPTIKLFNGNGFAFVRLFDSTHGAPLPNSEVKTKEQKDTIIISNPIRFLEGRNLIKVQIKSLTADTAIFTSGRLRIITEN